MLLYPTIIVLIVVIVNLQPNLSTIAIDVLFAIPFLQLMNVQLLLTALKILLASILLMDLFVSVHLGSWVMERSVEMVVFWTNAHRYLTALKILLALILLMDLSVSVHLGSWAMEGSVEMVVFWTNVHQYQIVLKTLRVSTHLMALSVSVHLVSLEMVESVELDAMVS